MNTLKDKVVVITGSSGGLGLSLAKLLVLKGARVVISSRDEKKLCQVGKEMNILSVVADVTNEEEVSSLATIVTAEYGRIDYWINNAGIWVPHSSIEEMDIKKVHDMLEVNLFGTIYGSKHALMRMKKQGNGTIVNIISTSGLYGRANSSGYASSKWAVRGFTESLRDEVKDSNIKVIAVYPGGMKTNLFDEKKPDDYENYMTAESVAETIVNNLTKDVPDEELVIKRPEIVTFVNS